MERQNWPPIQTGADDRIRDAVDPPEVELLVPRAFDRTSPYVDAHALHTERLGLCELGGKDSPLALARRFVGRVEATDDERRHHPHVHAATLERDGGRSLTLLVGVLARTGDG